jgi:uncharacterized paraquat-inducible protein A
MIEFTLNEFFTVGIVVIFLIVGMGAVWWRFRDWREDARARHRTNRCRYCGTLFERSQERVQVEHCPGCHAAIQAGRERRLG